MTAKVTINVSREQMQSAQKMIRRWEAQRRVPASTTPPAPGKVVK